MKSLLVDADLFRCLRACRESRGAYGIDNLRRALRLETGQPFDKLRPGGWTWYESDRLDHHWHAASSIWLTWSPFTPSPKGTSTEPSGRLRSLRRPLPTRRWRGLTSPRSPLLLRHRSEAARIVRDEVFNRFDDGNPPSADSQQARDPTDPDASISVRPGGLEIAFSACRMWCRPLLRHR